MDASKPPSRPRPDCLTPPNGAAALEMTPRVEAHHPRLETVDHAVSARQIVRVDVGDETVLRVVGESDGLLFVAEARDREHRSEDLLAQVSLPAGDLVDDRGRKKVPGPSIA